MTQQAHAWLRFFLAAALIGGTGLLLRARSGAEEIPSRQPVSQFPRDVNGWTGRDVQLTEDTLRILGAGEFLQRIYRRNPTEPYIDFFLAYFPTQRAGSTWHSPQNCLPGSGWAPMEFTRRTLQLPDGRTFHMNQYIIAKGSERQLVFYWYQAHGRGVASEYWAKFYLIADAVRLNRSDGSLVRIITPVLGQDDLQAAEKRVVEFAQQILGNLDAHVPR